MYKHSSDFECMSECVPAEGNLKLLLFESPRTFVDSVLTIDEYYCMCVCHTSRFGKYFTFHMILYIPFFSCWLLVFWFCCSNIFKCKKFYSRATTLTAVTWFCCQKKKNGWHWHAQTCALQPVIVSFSNFLFTVLTQFSIA